MTERNAQILKHLQEVEISQRYLPYKQAVNQTALVFGLTEAEVEEIVLADAHNLTLTDEAMEILDFPETVIKSHGNRLSDAQNRIIELDKKKSEYKQFIEDYKAATEALINEIGVGSMFQDADGIVYKTTVPNGKFVYFDKYEVCRTRRADETKGSLSITEARAAGFVVEGK